MEGRGEGAGFCHFKFCNQCIDWIQGSSSIYSSLKLCRKVYAQGGKIPIRLIPHNYFVSDQKLFNKKASFVFVYILIIFQF